MTGPSIPSRAKDPAQKKRMLKYYRKLSSMILITSGSALLIEHLFTYGGFDMELLGNEWYGLLMICMAMLLSLKWEQAGDVLRAIRTKDLLAILEEGVRKK